MIKSIAAIAGMPRSGTSWLGEIVNSSPDVAYFFQPLFSYAFRGRLRHDSTPQEMNEFFDALFHSNDEFLTQQDKRVAGAFPRFTEKHPSVLAFKTCRYQYLIPKLLANVPSFRLIGIVRHPCGAIHSWLQNPKEFPAGADPRAEWRFGGCKNEGREEEFFGYYKWKEVANLYLDLRDKYPGRVLVVRYEDLVNHLRREVEAIYNFLGLQITEQTRTFLSACQSQHDDSPYSVFKMPEVATRWRKDLLPEIQREIEIDLAGTRLSVFTVEEFGDRDDMTECGEEPIDSRNIIKRNRHQGMLHVGRPNIGDTDVFRELTQGILESRWFTNNGAVVREFEARLCQCLGVRHCIPVCNGTVGLQIACHALGLEGEVLVPAFTFVATPHAVQWEGLQPVFVDVDPHTHCIDPHLLEQQITERTSAIIGVHLWGRPCNTRVIEDVAKTHGLRVVYDAAHAFNCSVDGRMVGNFGDCEVFSFHATKFFNTFEGGAIATNDDMLADRIRLMKNFGFAGMDQVVHLGTNGKMPEICAAMGLACFEKMDEFVAINSRNYAAYRTQLASLPGVNVMSYDDVERTNYQYIVVEIDEREAGASRDEVFRHLHDVGIRARRYFYPGCHRMEPYRTLYRDQLERLPHTDELCLRVLILPTGTAVSLADVQRVCDAVRQCISNAAAQRRPEAPVT